MNLLKLSSKAIFLIVGMGILFTYAMFQGGFVSWFLFYSFLPFLVYSILFAFYPFSFWKIERVIDHPSNYEVGDTVKVQLQLARKVPFPLYFLMITDNFSLEQKKMMVFPLFKRKITVTYELTELPRGEHIFKDIKIMSADLLGLIKKEHIYNEESMLLIYPKVQRINLFFLQKYVGNSTVARGLDLTKETLVPTGVREYQRGDRLSWVNWKMTARKNVLMSKEFEKTEDHHYVIWLDRYRQIGAPIFEKMVQVTASISDELNKMGHPATLISVGKDRTIVAAKKISDWRRQVLYHFAVVKNDSNLLLHDVVEQEKERLPQKGTIVFVTEKLDTSLMDRLSQIVNNHRKVVVIQTMTIPVAQPEKQASYQNIIIKSIDEFMLGAAEVNIK